MPRHALQRQAEPASGHAVRAPCNVEAISGEKHAQHMRARLSNTLECRAAKQESCLAEILEWWMEETLNPGDNVFEDAQSWQQ